MLFGGSFGSRTKYKTLLLCSRSIQSVLRRQANSRASLYLQIHAAFYASNTTYSTMKLFVAIVFAVLAVATVTAQDQYTTKYDGIDLDEILKSDRLFNNYFKCLMDEGRCTPDGNELKRILPEALQTNCAKCSEKQRAGAISVINYMIDNRKEQWDALQKKYDPENLYVEKYREEAKKEGIKLE
ncbi:sensory appendage protein [Anopheles darlingi]|uniref:Sensory appendage protein n=1 Tax=Anopheles darlingi TaxID=43151 RepID=W5JM80_ANODA|nr:sensory appendage protein [Anopheles darlingi]